MLTHTIVILAFRRGGGLVGSQVVVGACLLAVVAVATPLRLSGDAWAYLSYGRLVSDYGRNPYVDSPETMESSDPYRERVDPRWVSAKSVYGPSAVALFAASTAIGGESPTRSLWVLRMAFLASFLAVTYCLRQRVDALLMLCSPLVVTSVLNGLHVDLLVGAAALVAVKFLDRERWLEVGLSLGLAASLKISAAALVGAVLVFLAASRRLRGASQVAGYALGSFVASTLAFGGPRVVLGPVGDAAHRFSSFGLWSGLRRSLVGAVVAHGGSGSVAAESVARWLPSLALVCAMLIAALLARRAARVQQPFVGEVGIVALHFTTYTLPWYAAMGIPAVVFQSEASWALWLCTPASLEMVGYAFGRSGSLGPYVAMRELIFLVTCAVLISTLVRGSPSRRSSFR